VDLDERISAICVSVVSGVGLDEVILRFGGDVTTSTRTTFADAFNSHPGPTYVLAAESAAGVVVAENNGWWGVRLAERVSCGGTLAAYSSSGNADMTYVHAVDGTVVATFDPLLDEVTSALAAAAVGLDFDDESVGAPSFALLARFTGVRIEQHWLLDEPHLRVVVPSPH